MSEPIASVEVPDEIRDQLRAALLDETDLLTALRAAPLEEIPGQAGHARCVTTLTVRRPLDPETSELRRVEVLLRAGESGWSVYAVNGLGGS